jgi:AcrR family transcriptional regulator
MTTNDQRPTTISTMSPRPRATSDAKILAATHRVVSRLGPNLTLADVAKEAGVSPATLMQRFGSKRGLLLAFAAGGAVGLEREFEGIRATHRSPLASVYAVAECVAAMADTPKALSNSLAFLQVDLVDPEFHQHALAHSRGMQAGIRAMLDEAVAEGELARGDTRRLTRAVQAIIGGSLLQWAIDRDGKVTDRLREDLDALLKPRVAGAPKVPHDEVRRERRRHPRRRVTHG